MPVRGGVASLSREGAGGEVVGAEGVGAAQVTPLAYIELIRQSRPDSVAYFTGGGCWELFRLLRRQFPQAQPYHTWSDLAGHIGTMIGGRIYDIRGVRPASRYEPFTDRARIAKAHRWVRHMQQYRANIPQGVNVVQQTPYAM